MKRTALATILALVTTLTAPPLVHRAAAEENDARVQSSLSIPIQTETFTGTFKLQRFANIEGTVHAVGVLTGTGVANGAPATAAAPGAAAVSAGELIAVVQTVALPLLADATQASCDILHLELGPLELDLLGLVVNLNRVVLDIDAEPGAGNLLGNLLCSVAGLLDRPGQLARILNQILRIIGA